MSTPLEDAGNRVGPLSPLEQELYRKLMKYEASAVNADDYLFIVDQGSVVPNPRRVLAVDMFTQYLDANFASYADAYLFDGRYDDFRVAASSTNVGLANAPDLVKYQDDGSGSVGVWIPSFAPGSREEVFFTVQLPHGWVEGSTIYPHIHWTLPNANAGDVVWGIEYSWANIGENFPQSTIDTITVSSHLSALYHAMDFWTPIDGTGKEHSSMIMFRVFRDATNLADDYAADAGFLEFDFHYRIEAIGEVFGT